MNFFGFLVGIVTLLIVGLGFPLVIQGERYFGYLWWPYMMALGFILVMISLFISPNWFSASVGVLGATFVWGSTELKEQAVRTKLGWYLFHNKKILPPFAESIKKWRAPHL